MDDAERLKAVLGYEPGTTSQSNDPRVSIQFTYLENLSVELLNSQQVIRSIIELSDHAKGTEIALRNFLPGTKSTRLALNASSNLGFKSTLVTTHWIIDTNLDLRLIHRKASSV